MIISKDLFIFGEQIFATIIPESGLSQGSQQTQQTQQTQQQLPSAIINATLTTTTSLKLASKSTAVTSEPVVVESLKAITAAATASIINSTITSTTTATTTTTTAETHTATNLTTTTTAIKPAVSIKTLSNEEKFKIQNNINEDPQETKMRKRENFVENGGIKINTTTKPIAAIAPTTSSIVAMTIISPTTAEIEINEEQSNHNFESSPSELSAFISGAVATEEDTEKEILVKRNLIKATTSIVNEGSANLILTLKRQNDESSLLEGNNHHNYLNQQQHQQQQQQEPKQKQLERKPEKESQHLYTQNQQQKAQGTDCCLQVETEALLPLLTAAGEPTTATIKPLKVTASLVAHHSDQLEQHKHCTATFNSEDLSLKMSKVMLSNTKRTDHTMVTFPFISDHHRSLQLTFQNLNVVHNDRKILSDVSGSVNPGEVLAIMGPSGSGKTTLLDCLSGQRRIDNGRIRLNCEPLSKKWRRKICYVLQEEVFFSGLTLRETVMYTALLRLPEKMSKAEKIILVDRILETLELNFCQQTKFGDYLNRGLSGGEKKRANIACELLTNPLLMLLDEPTSGLDSHSAISLMKVLKRYAIQEQKTVVITVHQPSSQMFHMFDKLLLLYNGRTAYFGEVKNIYRYFEDIGVAIKPHYNPADFVLEQLKSYPDIREKLFIAAKESHGNFLNRNCITVPICTNIHSKNQNGLTVTSTNGKDTYSNAPTVTVSEKSRQHNTLINNIINNYYKDIKNNHNLNHNRSNQQFNNDAILIIDDEHQHHHHHLHNHHNSCDHPSQHIWCGTDSHSNFSSSSNDYHQFEDSNNWLDYPTCFYTQFRVLSNRNFKEAKPRMLSKLNWFQTVGLAFMAGAIWFQIPRTEEFLHDLQGWMFFSQTYWMLFALFGALNSFPSEREVISKERRSGAYRLSAYYLAKMFGELPLVITLPTVYLMISYPMLGCSSVKLFLLMLVFLLLNTIVAQSVGFFIGACCMDMNVSITLSALYTLATQLFGGYLSSRIPDGLSWVRFTSMIHYAYQNMQILEFQEGPSIKCGNPSSYEICKNNTTLIIPYKEILKAQNSNLPLWLNTLILMVFFVLFRVLGYAVLRYLRCPKT